MKTKGEKEMNEALKEALDIYYNSEEYCGDRKRYTDIDVSFEEFERENPEKGREVHFLCNRYEYEGFLQGYMYCLTMLGRNPE